MRLPLGPQSIDLSKTPDREICITTHCDCACFEHKGISKPAVLIDAIGIPRLETLDEDAFQCLKVRLLARPIFRARVRQIAQTDVGIDTKLWHFGFCPESQIPCDMEVTWSSEIEREQRRVKR